MAFSEKGCTERTPSASITTISPGSISRTTCAPTTSSAGVSEASIVEIDGRTAGLYRDAGGDLRAVSAVCPHMGCPLGWNPVDRTWDCACHGSRFAADGAMVHGPAVGPLSTIALPADGGRR